MWYVFILMINIFYFQENDRIFHVKLEISVRTGFVFSKFRLYLDGARLSDGMTLSDCGIENESIIELFFEQYGC